MNYVFKTVILILEKISVKQRRLSYNGNYKLNVINYAKQYGNRTAERHFGSIVKYKKIPFALRRMARITTTN